MYSRLSAGLLAALPLLSSVVQGYEVQTPPLDTEWTYTVGTDAWPEYPRPLIQRSRWQNLNGVWKWVQAAGQDEAIPAANTLSQDILVPSCQESGLSGVQQQNVTYSWWVTSFERPTKWTNPGEKVLLNFEAVDYEATVFLNGQRVGAHTGGYWHFSFDITKFLVNGTNTLAVNVFDPTDAEMIPVGKQALEPSHIFYTPCSGIWQSVWLEPVPATYISQLDVSAGMDGDVNITITTEGEAESAQVSVMDDAGSIFSTQEVPLNQAFQFVVDQPKLWSPSSPTLYNISITVGDDSVTSYTGFRTISSGEINGIKRPLINGEFFFQFGTLDQGFWPDGLYTPPSREAMVYDLEVLKDLGLNMLRKHIKVEPALFYQACDQMGLLVIQDMPSMPLRDPSPADIAEFNRQLEILIKQHRNYPSIYTWMIYNEGWAQGPPATAAPEAEALPIVRGLDSTRLIDAVSGWHDHGYGDWHDNHHYANPQCGTPFYSIASTPYDPKRIAIQGEFGGIGQNTTEDHLWKVQAAVNTINQTYEIDENSEAYNYRGHLLLTELREQIEKYSCSAAVWTQTTDVEGEVNGFLTYDRRVLRTDKDQWKADIQALYDAAQTRV